MPLSALSPVPDFLLWSPSPYYNPTFLLSSDSVFSTKNAPKLQKQFPSMTTYICRQSVHAFVVAPTDFDGMAMYSLSTAGANFYISMKDHAKLGSQFGSHNLINILGGSGPLLRMAGMSPIF